MKDNVVQFKRPEDMKVELDFSDDWTIAEVMDEFAKQNAVTEYLMTWKDTEGNSYYSVHLPGDSSEHKQIAIRMADELADDLESGQYD